MPRRTSKLPGEYTIKTNRSVGCRRCGHGNSHRILSPYGMETGLRYTDLGMAKSLVQQLNAAMAAGERLAELRMEEHQRKETLRLARNKKYIKALSQVADAKTKSKVNPSPLSVP